jgi:hypothetical protein
VASIDLCAVAEFGGKRLSNFPMPFTPTDGRLIAVALRQLGLQLKPPKGSVGSLN